MSKRKYKTVATLVGVKVVEDYTYRIFKMKNGLNHKGISCIEAADYPLGTRMTITLEEPEPPKELIVLPEGMEWKNNNLWYHGARIARVNTISDGGYHCVPHSTDPVYFREFQNMEEGKQIIENALADRGYFGVRKVVDNG